MKSLLIALTLSASALCLADIAAPPSADEDLPGTLTAAGRISLYRIYFEAGKAVLKKESDPLLERIRDLLAKQPDLRLRIEGHTEARGSSEWNLKLSQARADAVKAWLVAHAIDGGRLEAVGFGETKPIADNRTNEGRARNRRVDLVRLGPGARRGGNGATLSGTVRFSGTALPPIAVKYDAQHCGGPERADSRILIGERNGLADAVVLLVGVPATTSMPPIIEVAHSKCDYQPRMQLVHPDALARISNLDQTLHNTHAYLESETIFNYAQPPGAKPFDKKLDREGVVTLRCDVHPWESGAVVVTRWRGTITDGNGRFEFHDVPAGTWQLKVWHGRMKAEEKPLIIGRDAPATVDFDLKQ